MSDTPETANNEVSMQELVQGIGRLVIRLNDSIVKVDQRVEKLETGLSTLLEQSFRAVTEELSRTNELLEGMAPEDLQAPQSGSTGGQVEGMLEKLDQLKVELSGIREDMAGTEEKLLTVLRDGPEDLVGKEVFTATLNDLSVMVSESTRSLEETVSRVMVESGEEREKIFSENVKLISDGLTEISSRMDQARESIGKKLEEIESRTAEEVASIGAKVMENSQSQKEQLDSMRELLSLHSVEVQDNRVRELNRSAIVHFNNAEYRQAMSDLKEALELSPESSELLANMAHIEAFQGNLEKAEELFEKALEIDPDLEPAISGLGTVMVMSGRPGDTIDFLSGYLDGGSDASTGVMIALSRAYAAQDNHARALSLLERAEEAAPGHPELEQELARYRS
ncbi:MAG: tetratricopeptide repeat protein [Candidatus Aegiribacteria sp.]